jgi:hypothetical protein
LATSAIFIKRTKVSNRPRSENSPDLVTLLAATLLLICIPMTVKNSRR